MAHLNKEGLITDNQHGFRQGRPCETQLAIFVHDIQSVLDKGKEIDAVFLDFAKTFDMVPHQHLLLKLKHLALITVYCPGYHLFSLVGNSMYWLMEFFLIG